MVSRFKKRLANIGESIRRSLFARRYGLDAYDAVHGRELRDFLNMEYGQRSWSWQLKLMGVDRENSVFKVRYDDCGAWAGVVAVAPHRQPSERFRILVKDEREWPPRDWND